MPTRDPAVDLRNNALTPSSVEQTGLNSARGHPKSAAGSRHFVEIGNTALSPSDAELARHSTVAETSFFRHPAQFEFIAAYLNELPQLPGHAKDDRVVRVWSAACSTGEEAYSTAMVLEDVLSRRAGWSFEMSASDIQSERLGIAAAGRYTAWSFRNGVPKNYRAFFQSQGKVTNVVPAIRNCVRFFCFNLAQPVAAYSNVVGVQAFDIVLFRNAAMYMDEATLRDVVTAMATSIRDGGLLMLGPADPRLPSLDFLERVRSAPSQTYRICHRRVVRSRRADVPQSVLAVPVPAPRRETAIETRAAVPRKVEFDTLVDAGIPEAPPVLSDQALDCFRRGATCMQHGEFRASIRLLDEAIQLDGDFIAPRVVRSIAAKRLGLTALARESAREAFQCLERLLKNETIPELHGASREDVAAFLARLLASDAGPEQDVRPPAGNDGVTK